jgi:hypothetical protein
LCLTLGLILLLLLLLLRLGRLILCIFRLGFAEERIERLLAHYSSAPLPIPVHTLCKLFQLLLHLQKPRLTLRLTVWPVGVSLVQTFGAAVLVVSVVIVRVVQGSIALHAGLVG